MPRAVAVGVPAGGGERRGEPPRVFTGGDTVAQTHWEQQGSTGASGPGANVAPAVTAPPAPEAARPRPTADSGFKRAWPQRLFRWSRWLHIWIGVAVGLLMLALSITGTFVAFKN